MTTASVVLAAALAAWGAFPTAASAPASDAVDTAEAAPIPTSPPPSVPAPPAVRQIFDEPPLIATPARRERSRPQRLRPVRAPLYRDWRFWTISGGLFAATVVVTILVTRPGPQPFAGNFDPKVIFFP